MKFVISLLFLTTTISAAPIVLTHELQWNRVNLLREIFLTTYQIPFDLISTIPVKDCDQVKATGKINLCIKKNGDLITVSVDQRFIKESLQIFLAPKQEQK